MGFARLRRATTALVAITATGLLVGGTPAAFAGPPPSRPQPPLGSAQRPAGPLTSAGTTGSKTGRTQTWTSEAAAEYWTAERMAAATPEGPKGAVPAPGKATPAPEGGGSPRTAAGKTGKWFDGVPAVGVLFTKGSDAKLHYCTASVVTSPGRNVILTAAHCTFGRNAMFIPQYQKGVQPERQPFGVFAVQKWFRDARYVRNTKGPYSDLDFAFGRVSPNAKRKNVQDATGAAYTPGRINGNYRNTVTVIGYPHQRHVGANKPAIRCDDVKTTRLTGYQQMRMECARFYGGTSGSPWVKKGTNTVIGNLGGWNGGGPENNSDRISFSTTFGDRAFELYEEAKRSH